MLALIKKAEFSAFFDISFLMFDKFLDYKSFFEIIIIRFLKERVW